MNAYKEESGKDVQVLLLQNHGIFVAANTVEEIGVLFDGVISKLEKQVKRTADVSDAQAIVDSVMTGDNDFAKKILVKFSKLSEERWKQLQEILEELENN